MTTRRKRKPHRITTMHVRDMPVDLKAQFKGYCARHDYSMQQAIKALMIQAIETDMRLK